MQPLDRAGELHVGHDAAQLLEHAVDLVAGEIDLGVARRIEQISRGVFKVNPGSLLTALQRLERSGWLDAEWCRTENARRAKVYKLTRAGKKQLESETADWSRRTAAIARLLKAEG